MNAFPKSMLTLVLVAGLVGGRLVADVTAARLVPRALIEVTNLNDSGPGSLRQAILDANALPGADTISIHANGQLNLASALPAITEQVTIDVPGASTFRVFIVDGQNLYRGFTIAAVPVTIAGLTVQNAAAFGNLSGGGIYAEGDLTLSQVLVLNSTASGGAGGGVYSAGSLLVNGGRYEGNQAETGGGGLAAAGTMTVIGSTIRGNRCLAVQACNGGGLRAGAGLTLTNTLLVGNESRGGGGGAWAGATMQVNGGRFESNLSATRGGGFVASNGLTLSGTVIISNTTVSRDGGGGYASGPLFLANARFEQNQCLDCNGGGLRAASDDAVLKNVDFVRNFASNQGGGLQGYIVRIEGSRFVENSSHFWVGGLYATTAVLTYTHFISNTGAESGGAVLSNVWATGGLFQGNAPGGLSAATAVLSGTQFLNNVGSPAAAVGSVVATGVRFAGNDSGLLAGGLETSGPATVRDSEFVGNRGQQGGGIYATGQLTLTGSLLAANSALTEGGGLYARGTLLIDSTLFLGNSASAGGGIAHETGPGLVVNSLLAGNIATTGAAMLLDGEEMLTLRHVTIGSASQSPGAAIVTAKEVLLVENTIVADHATGVKVTGGFATLNTNLFHGNGLDVEGPVGVESGHLVGNPKFVDPASDNFHLQAGSAAINSGVNAGVTVDIDGEPRPALGGYDLGYDEIQVLPPEPGVRVMLPFIRR